MVAVGVCLLIPNFATAFPVIVYDNTTSPTSGSWAPDGIWQFSYYTPYEPMGDQITLGGTDRAVTRVDLMLSSTGPTTLSSLNLKLYLNDGYAVNGFYGAPGTLQFSGTLTNVAVNGLTRVSFDVPTIPMQDTFTWIASADSMDCGMATFNPPTTGSSADRFWDYTGPPYTEGWYKLSLAHDPVANFGATVYAVPEPGSLTLLAAGALAVLRRRRRRGEELELCDAGGATGRPTRNRAPRRSSTPGRL